MSEWIVSSSILIILVIGIRHLFRNRLAMRVRYALWLLVAVRLLVPVSFTESALSVLNYVDFRTEAPGQGEEGTSLAGEPEGPNWSEEPHVRDASEAVDMPMVPLAGADAGAPSLSEGGTGEAAGQDPASADREGTGTSWTSGDRGDGEGSVLSETMEGVASGGSRTSPERTGLAALLRDVLAGISPFFGIWLLGAALLAGTVLAMNRNYRKRVYASRERYDTEWESRIPVYVSEAVAAPCMFGLIHPAVYLNSRAAGERRSLRYVLSHENVHYMHGDNLWVLVRAACVCLHWYNPLVWLAACLSRQDGELACDERAMELLGEGERIRYGRALLDFSEQGGVLMGGLKLSTAMSGGKKQLKERLLMIVREPRRHMGALAVVTALALLCSALTFTGRVRGQEMDAAGNISGTGAVDAVRLTGDEPGRAQGGSAQSTSIVPIDLNDGMDYALKIAGEADLESGGYHIYQIELNRIRDRTEETLQTIRPEDARVLYTRPQEDIRRDGGGMWTYAADREALYAKPLCTVEHLPASEAGNFLADGDSHILSDVVGGAIFVADLNFDGYQDFCLQGSLEDSNVPYYCYLWNPQERRFEPGYMIPNVRVDRESGLIESSTDDGDGRLSTKYYRFDEEDVLHMVRYVEENQSPDALFPALDLTYCEASFALPAVDEWDYGTQYGGALPERFVYWAREALRELYEWSGTKIDKACFCVTSFGDVTFGNTPEDIRASRTFYSRCYGGRAGFEECIEQMGLSTERVVWFSPVTQWNVPEGIDQMTNLELVEWYFGRSPLAKGEKIASIQKNSEEDYVIEAESGNYYWAYINLTTREISSFCGPYDGYPEH